MVYCTYCGQSFTRDEHLERHILTHTNVKPFKCLTCHMSFARRDLLQRHFTVHGRDQNNQEGLPPNYGMMPKTAGRTPIACTNCAKTKTKCDKKFPCSRCASRNLKCTLRPTRRYLKQTHRKQETPNLDRRVNDASTGSVPQQTKTPEDSKCSSPQPRSNFEEQGLVANVMAGMITETPASQQGVVVAPTLRSEVSPIMFLDSHSMHNDSVALPTIMSPLPTPDLVSCATFVNATPMCAMEECGIAKCDGIDEASSPQLLVDWNQLQLARAPSQFEAMSRVNSMIMETQSNLEMDFLRHSPNASLFSSTGFVQAPPMTGVTPMTAMLEGTMSDLEVIPASAGPQDGARKLSNQEIEDGELAAVITIRAGWNCFRSTPKVPSSQCPRTACLHLKRLEQTLRNHEGWANWRLAMNEVDSSRDNLVVTPLLEASRDKLLAIMQSFLHKALDIHRDESASTSPGIGSPRVSSSNFVLLPPGRVLEYFLRIYGNSFECFYPTTPRRFLDANHLLLNAYDDKASTLLVLLMIAQGAMYVPSMDAQCLNAGLTEACRISLLDLVEKNISMASDSIVLQAAMIFVSLAAWSGDKWQMDIAMGQRGMYFAMLRHSGILEPQRASPPPDHSLDTPTSVWNDWLQGESKSRLAYSYLLLDQDLSLFWDTAPLFNVNEFALPMPDADRLWQANSAADWATAFNEVHRFANGLPSAGSGVRPFSLRNLFKHFLDETVISKSIEMTPLQLRLLLHPIQNIVYQCRQLLNSLGDTTGNGTKSNTAIGVSTRCQLDQMQTLLQRWHKLAGKYLRANDICPIMQTSLLIYHLISLDTVTNLSDIESLARGEIFDGSYQQLLWAHERCIFDVEHAVFHAGQALRCAQALPKSTHPPWWPAAIYRVALVLWANSLSHTESISPANGLFPVPGPTFAVDALAPDHPLLVRYLTKREGVPTLTNANRTQLPLDQPANVLHHCIGLLDESVPTRFSGGIRAKLLQLAMTT